MRKLTFLFGAILLASSTLTSCGGSSYEEKETFPMPDAPTDLKYEGVVLIDGPLSEYVEVVPGSYLMEFDKEEDGWLASYNATMKVKFKFLKPIDVETGQGYNRYGPSLIGIGLDEQGAPLKFELSVNTDKDLATYLSRGSGEEWLSLYMSGQGSIRNTEDAERMLEKFKKGKKIRFNSEIVEEKFGSSSSSSSSASNSESSSNDCDKLLKEYKSFMNKYIAVLKKQQANPGDMSVMTEYSELSTEAGEWASKTTDCASDPSFTSKFAEIQMEIANAVSGM